MAGQNWPWGDPHRYPQSPASRWVGTGRPSSRRLLAAGIDVRVGPVAIANGRFGNRSHCIYRGFLPPGVQGQRQGVAADHPRTRRAGTRRRDPARLHGQPRRGRRAPPGHGGDLLPRRAPSTGSGPGWSWWPGTRSRRPRLLLNSACPQFPDGLCNDFDQVGRYVMVQGAPQTTGRYDEEIRSYKAPPPEGLFRGLLRDRSDQGLQAGILAAVHLTVADRVRRARVAQGYWGETLREYMRDYVHWATFGALCEFLPLPENRVTLADEVDRHGLPVANFSYSMCDNDKALCRGGDERSWRRCTMRPAPKRRSPSSATPTSSVVAAWPVTDGARGGGRQSAFLRGPESLRRRRQRLSDPGQRQSGTDHHGPRRPGRGLPDVS